jgi:hypothetical protein
MEPITGGVIRVLVLEDEAVVCPKMLLGEPDAVTAMVWFDLGAVDAESAWPTTEVDEQGRIAGLKTEVDDAAAGVGVAALCQLELEFVVDVMDACSTLDRFVAEEDVASLAAVRSHHDVMALMATDDVVAV